MLLKYRRECLSSIFDVEKRIEEEENMPIDGHKCHELLLLRAKNVFFPNVHFNWNFGIHDDSMWCRRVEKGVWYSCGYQWQFITNFKHITMSSTFNSLWDCSRKKPRLSDDYKVKRKMRLIKMQFVKTEFTIATHYHSKWSIKKCDDLGEKERKKKKLSFTIV